MVEGEKGPAAKERDREGEGVRKRKKLKRAASKGGLGARILGGGGLVVEDDSGLVKAMACDPSRRLSFRSETNLQKSRG